MIDKVTEPFFTTKDVGKGTGLGLSMVYGFAKQSGGGMKIVSEVARGTRVELWLPRAEERAAPAGRTPADASVDEPVQQSLRILLVDDHDGVREMTAALLKDLGHEIKAAANGPDTLDLLKRAPESYDLIITDYAMPMMSGGDLMDRVREVRSGMPGIIISGYADADSIERKPKDVVVLKKPFSQEQMNKALRLACPPPANGRRQVRRRQEKGRMADGKAASAPTEIGNP